MPILVDSCLGDFTRAELIVPQLQGRDAASVIRELSVRLQREAGVLDLLPFYQAALNREFLFSTAMDYGLAFPHARVSGLKRLSFALGRSADPLVWMPKSGPSVRLVFLCAVPATEATTYLQLISGLARLAEESLLLRKLLEAKEIFEILTTLRQIRLRQSND
ncbi:MAG TPA: PTS sugar transporter subunit IIA [Candidatus Paceibacterota bacterium]|nr:PTS sugar transporter subunit IIA [Verrucomicrobiota bacterium]HRY47382.1 PTS sugar transporter subunit IIA [Candidatus Paceibacterota bacterium]